MKRHEMNCYKVRLFAALAGIGVNPAPATTSHRRPSVRPGRS